jgi:hypothetical protein
MTKRGLVLLVFIIFCLSIPTVSRSDEILFGLDGGWWSAISKLEPTNAKLVKLATIRGIFDGIEFGDGEKEKYYYKTSFEHYIKALDQFYADYRNQQIIVVWAMQIVSMEMRGEPKSKIDSSLRRMRQIITHIYDNKK